MDAWKAQKVRDRDTLVTCPACKGSGSRITEFPDGKYTMSGCRWCGGVSGVTKEIQNKFKRWEKIKAYNRYRCRLGVVSLHLLNRGEALRP